MHNQDVSKMSQIPDIWCLSFFEKYKLFKRHFGISLNYKWDEISMLKNIAFSDVFLNVL